MDRRSILNTPANMAVGAVAGTVADPPWLSLTKNGLDNVELVAALNKGGRNIPIAMALDQCLCLCAGPGHDMARTAARVSAG